MEYEEWSVELLLPVAIITLVVLLIVFIVKCSKQKKEIVELRSRLQNNEQK